MTTVIEKKRNEKAKKIYDLIVQHYIETGFTPSHMELANRYGQTRGAINNHLERLVRKKFIYKDKNGHLCLPKKKLAKLEQSMGKKQ
tara:strand:+ start:133 stop:393 length:261 start_codon:yes stop_codon:yes gene_type:complete